MFTNGTERRHFIRANFPCKVIIEAPKTKIFNIHTENIGAGGIRVILEEKLEIGLLVKLELYLADKPIVRKGRVVWVVEKPAPLSQKVFLYDTGIEFYEISGDDKHIVGNLVKTISEKEETK